MVAFMKNFFRTSLYYPIFYLANSTSIRLSIHTTTSCLPRTFPPNCLYAFSSSVDRGPIRLLLVFGSLRHLPTLLPPMIFYHLGGSISNTNAYCNTHPLL